MSEGRMADGWGAKIWFAQQKAPIAGGFSQIGGYRYFFMLFISASNVSLNFS